MAGEDLTTVSVEFEEHISSSFASEIPLVNLVSEYFPNNRKMIYIIFFKAVAQSVVVF